MMVKRGESSHFLKESKHGQTTIFIILAIIIVVGVVLFFIFKQRISLQNIPSSIQPVYNSFLSCVEDKGQEGIAILESQGGYIELPKFEAGSTYSPFSSYLYFLGNPIPYWYYLSAGNIPKEQVPSKEKMQKELSNFIQEEISKCDFSGYYSEGFEITQKPGIAEIEIQDNKVKINLKLDLQISKGEDTSLISNHQIEVKSKLGSLYKSAIKIYETENKEFFLENYSIDVLRLYAPVDGVEISCSPKIWNTYEIYGLLQDAVEINIGTIKTDSPKSKSEKYFYKDFGIENSARFLNFKDWPFYLEVLPSEGSFLISKPVGNQDGLGVLGFCYTPYHFVYDLKYPVLAQVYSGEEVFQFPLAVIVDNNKPRKATSSSTKVKEEEICSYANTNISVKTYDPDFNVIKSDISYECFDETCDLGNTNSETLSFPQCVNGVVIAKSNGFKEEKKVYSTNQGGNIEMILDPTHELSINLKANGISYLEEAIIEFSGDGDSKIVYYPQQNKVNLSEGSYDVGVSVYKNASINFKETTQNVCVDALSSGIGALFGVTEKQCSNVTIPAQLISKALAGGGKKTVYLFEEDLITSTSLSINLPELKVPTSIQELQDKYATVESQEIEVNLT